MPKGRDYIPQGITEDDVRGHIDAAKQFFKEPRAATAETYREADELHRDLNIGAKALIIEGGKVPHVLVEVVRFLERLGMLMKGEEHYTYYQTLGKGTLPPVRDSEELVELQGFLALRSSLVVRHWSEGQPNRIIPKRAEEDALTTDRLVTTMSDVVHLRFAILCPDLREKTADRGWILPQDSNGDMKTMRRNIAESIIWRAHQLAETARQRSRKARQLRELSGEGHLSIISEERRTRAIKSGALPTFLASDMAFGPADITKPLPEADRRTIAARIQGQVEKGMHELVEQIVREVKDQCVSRFDDQVLRGGRPGLNPSRLYRDR